LEDGLRDVTRDDLRGEGTGRLNEVAGPAHAHAQTVQAAANWGMTQIIEADAANVIRALQSNEFDLAPEGILYRDIQAFIRLNFSSVQFSYRPRSCNKVFFAQRRWYSIKVTGDGYNLQTGPLQHSP
jgi:hypothetical protein